MIKKKITRFLRLMLDKGASDFHLTVGRPPIFRVGGMLEPIRYKIIKQYDWNELIRPITRDDLWEEFQNTNDVDFAYEVKGLARFRINLFRQERGEGAVFRVIPSRIMTLEQLGLPKQVIRLARIENGLILVTGPTGSGKSTTLAAIIDLINRTRGYHIITLEDPIEFVHENIKSLIHQRELGIHMDSFVDGLKSATREDPDVILVGELRDLDTIRMALESAEKGLLVFGTLHTNSAGKTIDRIINVFPAKEQESIRSILGETLRGVLAQQLLPRIQGGRIAALEMLFGSPALANIIREGKTHQIESYLQTGKKEGMISMDESILNLLKEKIISPRSAFDKSINKEIFEPFLKEEG